MTTITYRKTWGVCPSVRGGWLILTDGRPHSSGYPYKRKAMAEAKSLAFVKRLYRERLDFLGRQVKFEFIREDRD